MAETTLPDLVNPVDASAVDTAFLLRQLYPPAYLHVSSAFTRLTGYPTTVLTADSVGMLSLVHADDRPLAEQYCSASMRGQAAQVELRLVRADGEIRWMRIVSAPVPGPPGSSERMVISMEDVNGRVLALERASAAEAAARAANEAQSMFLSRISHELRTPLNAVIGFGQLLERRLADTEDASSVRHILKAGRHLLDMINEVLDISRIESGDLSVSLEPVEISGLIDDVVGLIQPIVADAAVTLTVQAGPPRLSLLADRQRLRQVLLNLLSNAVKYNQPGGHVWLGWTVDHGTASITVRDDGLGVPAAVQHRLFMPFDRLGAETTEVAGTGMGLAVSRALVELMNGEIAVTSTPPVGSTFTVTMPLAAPAASTVLTEPFAAELDQQLLAASAVTATSTLLYIEDNDPNVRVIRSLLRLRPNWQLLHAGHGSLGIELARSHRPDVVLLDLHLPDGFGLEVLADLKSDAATADIPVVVLSADASLHQIHRLLQAGAERYLTKPLDIRAVLELLDQIADHQAERFSDV